MPIQSDLSVSPYFDDFNENKNYYKVLFRPGVAVQARELNQLQTILQRQIERFGDNIFKRGTIVDGCDITFHPSFPYVKIRDAQTDSAPVNVNQYIGYFVKNEANVTPLVGAIQTVVDGFESRAPDLKTLYVRYVTTGYANVANVLTEQSSFSSNQTLTVYDPESPIEKITTFNASAGFANTNDVVILSSIAIQNSSGGTTFTNNFYVNDHVNNGTANVQIVAIDTTTNNSVVILRVKPRAVDLQAANSQLWTFTTNTNIQSTNTTPSDVATIVDIIGDSASAIVRTGAAGEIETITVTAKGTGYYVLPTVSIASPGATTVQIAAANLIAQTYLTKITVANDSVFSTGTGYAISVGKGVVYQKGYFSRVNEHLVLVEKYHNVPDQVVVGFDTSEQIINSNQDTSLLDNATGQPNATAPGANRLQLTPLLISQTKAAAEANTDFLPIVEFSGGNPFKQNKQTVYNVIGTEMSRRTYEESGNYVVDQFILNTKSANTLGNEASSFVVQIDPGVAYVNGNRVQTVANYEKVIQKGTDTFVSTNANISLNYGNYIRVKEFSGIFKFNIGDTVTLYPNPASYISGGQAGTVPSAAALGTALGTARIRSVVYESGTPGTAECVYRIYVFDVRVATANNISLIRSIFYNGTNKGVADAITEGGDAAIRDNNLSALLYFAGKPAVKTGNSFSYVYRTINDSGDIKLTANGLITFAASGIETFPYTAGSTLSTANKGDIIVVPMANADSAANIAGSVTSNATSTQVNGTATVFTSAVRAGDFIKIANSTTNIIRQVSRVANDTVLFLTSNGSTYTAANANLFFPANMPISLIRSNRTANVDSNSNNIVINIGTTISLQTNVAVAYNVRAANVTPVVKSVARNRFIRLRLANNATTNTGPWALGVSDVFRMGGVYLGSNATFTDSTGVDVTSDFYIDHNQNENYYGISYLYRKSTASQPITTSDYLLVKIDMFDDSGQGLKAPGSGGTYAINDTANLAASSTSINTLEIPEVYSTKGDYYDLRDQFDFRPKSANTVAANTIAGNAPINPTEPSDLGRFDATDKRFPAPDSTLTGTIEYYIGRTDRVVVDDTGQFFTIKGTPGAAEAPPAPDNALTINILKIPPYPSHPYRLSAPTVAFADSKIANEKYTNDRLKKYRVDTPIDSNRRRVLQPRGYTMQDIGSLERRISDLEYYVSYTLIEALVQKKTIPSSANSSVDRAKFGFFVDSFDNYKFADTNNPGYNASIVDGVLCPRVDEINLPLKSVVSSDKVTLPYNEKVIISQLQATDGPLFVDTATGNTNPTDGTVIVTPVANTSTGSITLTPAGNTSSNTTVVQSITAIMQSEKTRSGNDGGGVFEEFFYTFSETTGPVEFYLNARDNNIAMEVFQSQAAGGPWTSIQTSATAAAITSADITSKSLNTLNNNRKIEHPGTLNRKSYGPVGFWIEDQFKMLWSHDPTNGVYYKIRVYKGKNHGGQGKSGTFGYKIFYPIDSTVNAITPINGFTPTINYSIEYAGMFIDPAYGASQGLVFDISQFNLWSFYPSSSVMQPVVDTTPISNEQIFNASATGLKPNTSHKFYFEGIDVTNKTKQVGGLLGSGLVSDANGKIDFIFYYYPDIEAVTQVSADAAAIAQATSAKAILITSADGSSTAKTTIQIRQYVKEAINTPPATYNTTTLESYSTVGGGKDFVDLAPVKLK